MSLREIKLAMDFMCDNTSWCHFRGVQPTDRVARAQTVLGVRFPPTYLDFVSKLGCASAGGAEFYGVLSDEFENSAVPDAVWMTKKMRKDSRLPAGLVIVGSTGDGGYYAIDTSRTNGGGESPVVEWWPGAHDGVDHQCDLASDFGTFFLVEITQAVSRAKSLAGRDSTQS